MHKSHIADPQRLSRLFIAACLAYIWIVYVVVTSFFPCAHRDLLV